jgi:hypothetical protein
MSPLLFREIVLVRLHAKPNVGYRRSEAMIDAATSFVTELS